MKVKLIQALLPILLVAVALTSCDNSHPGFKKSKNGTYYQLVSQVDSTSHIKIDSGMLWQLRMSYGSQDSLLFDAAVSNSTFDLPYQEPSYPGDINEALSMFAKGDSAIFIVKADSFFLKTAKSPEVPEMFKENNDLYFWVKIEDIVSMEQLEAKKMAEMERRKNQELADLAIYLSNNYPDIEPTESGLFIIKDKKGTGRIPKDGDMITFNFTVSVLNGEQIYDSEQAGRPMELEKGQPFDTEGFSEGLNSMRQGDELTLIVPSKLAFKEQGRQGMILPYTTMVYTIKLMDVKSKAQFEKEQAAKKAQEEAKQAKLKDQEAITVANYLKENNITVQPIESGLYYIETAQGTGEQAVAGDKVKVHYHGTLLDGTKFDSSYDRGSPYEFTLGKGQVIKGWDQGIALMKVGGKATLIVPSDLAYGASARSDVIHAYAPLKFEVELVEVTKAE